MTLRGRLPKDVPKRLKMLFYGEAGVEDVTDLPGERIVKGIELIENYLKKAPNGAERTGL